MDSGDGREQLGRDYEYAGMCIASWAAVLGVVTQRFSLRTAVKEDRMSTTSLDHKKTDML